MPTPTPHWSLHSIDPAQRTAVVSLFPPKQRKSYRRKRGVSTVTGQSVEEEEEEPVTPLAHYTMKNSDDVFRNVLGSIPTTALTMLGLAPCLHGYDCSHRPCEETGKEHESSLGVLHSCPVCMAKIAVICQDCKSAFSPLARERLLLSCFSTQPLLKRIRKHETLEWSRSLISAVELEVFGSEADASAAYAAWKKCTPKHFEKFRHKFKSLHGEGPISQDKMLEYEVNLNRNLNNHPSASPPYPSEKRVEQPRQRPSNILEKDVSKLGPWRAGPDMVWNEHSLVVREKSVEAVSQEYWIDPLKTKFGGISQGQHPPKQSWQSESEPIVVASPLPSEESPKYFPNHPAGRMLAKNKVSMEDTPPVAYTIKRAGGMYSYGSFAMERARILPTESDESARSHANDSESLSLATGSSIRSKGSSKGLASPKSPAQKAKLRRKQSKRIK